MSLPPQDRVAASDRHEGAGDSHTASRGPWSRIQGYYQRKSARLVFKSPMVIRLERPLISFTFDDFPRSALWTGGAILDRFGVSGTYYVSLGLQGTQQPSGEMFTAGDVAAVLELGHELGCHTYGHCHSWDTDTRTFESSVLENREALSKLVAGAEFQTFSYPISPPRPLTKAKVSRHFRCCRGNTGQTMNRGTADLNQLEAYFLEKSRHNLSAIQNVIDRNRELRGWLIFGTHDISENPTPYGCTPKFFQDVVEYAIASGAQVAPVLQALNILGAGKLPSHGSAPTALDGEKTLSRQVGSEYEAFSVDPNPRLQFADVDC
jgi:peptidoglycan/xylan/chitin deacetylase (PgdA/CDA1 family)